MRNRFSSFFLLFLALIQFTACAQERTLDERLSALLNYSVDTISVGPFAREIALHPGIIILDARSSGEFEVSHLQHAQFVDFDHFDLKMISSIDKNTPIVVYCTVGYRSEKIAEKIKKNGYSDVRNLYGGICEWVNHGFPVVGKDGRVTRQVHTYNKTWSKWFIRGEKVWE